MIPLSPVEWLKSCERGLESVSPSPEGLLGLDVGICRLDCPSDGWWFIGDIHGDFLALHTLVRGILQVDSEARICLLGDLIDRGIHDLACIQAVLNLANQRPGKIAWIAGNHDIGLQHAKGRFSSTVNPAECAADLNLLPTDSPRRSFAQAVIPIISRLPVGLLFTDGLLAVHGGIPPRNMHALVAGTTVAGTDLRGRWCSQRPTQNNTKRMLSADSRNYAHGDVAEFRAHAQSFLPFARIIRGHCHEGWLVHPYFIDTPLLTITGFSRPSEGTEKLLDPRDLPCVPRSVFAGKGVRDALPVRQDFTASEHDAIAFELRRLEHLLMCSVSDAVAARSPMDTKPLLLGWQMVMARANSLTSCDHPGDRLQESFANRSTMVTAMATLVEDVLQDIAVPVTDQRAQALQGRLAQWADIPETQADDLLKRSVEAALNEALTAGRPPPRPTWKLCILGQAHDQLVMLIQDMVRHDVGTAALPVTVVSDPSPPVTGCRIQMQAEQPGWPVHALTILVAPPAVAEEGVVVLTDLIEAILRILREPREP